MENAENPLKSRRQEDNTNMEVTRIFHPVGQGAFYTESFDDQHMVVYDCGSESDKKLLNYLEELFHESPKRIIDAVFISHLHSDHINGLEKLIELANVKKIFLPLLTPNRIVEAFLFNRAFFPSRESEQVNNFILRMLDSTISPSVSEIEEYNADSIPEGGFFYIDEEQNSSHKVSSGTMLVYKQVPASDKGYLEPMWVYIPFNLSTPAPSIHNEYINTIKNDDEREKVLSIAFNILSIYKSIKESKGAAYIQLLEVVNQKYQKHKYFEPNIPDELPDELDKKKGVDILKKVYWTLFGKIDNSQSMPVFSGVTKKLGGYIEIEKNSNILNQFCKSSYWHSGRCHCMPYCGCEEKVPCNFLYMGDFETKKSTNFRNLKAFYDYCHVWDTLCGIQIPHHGSRNNYHIGLYENRCFAVASVGAHNTYGHPNIDTLINMANQGCCPSVVTEDANTMKYQKFQILI